MTEKIIRTILAIAIATAVLLATISIVALFAALLALPFIPAFLVFNMGYSYYWLLAYAVIAPSYIIVVKSILYDEKSA